MSKKLALQKSEVSELALQKMLVDHHIGELPKDSKKKVLYLMQGDGVWQIRKNKIGTFYIHQAETRIPGLPSNMEEGWELDVPLVPSRLLKTTLSFFRAIYKKHQSEAHVQFFYDTKAEEYILNCPKQKVSGGSVSYENTRSFESPEKILVLEMHSHGGMSAFFSGTDDGDEKDDRFFGVVGKIGQFYPEIKLRLSIGGHKIEVDVDEIFDVENELCDDFPKEWLRKVKKQKIRTFKSSAFPGSRFHSQLPLFEKQMQHVLEEPNPSEVAKFLSGDYLYPNDAFVPEEGEYYLEEGDKKWFIQDGEKLFYIDEDGNHHTPDDDDDDDSDDYFSCTTNWRDKRF